MLLTAKRLLMEVGKIHESPGTTEFSRRHFSHADKLFISFPEPALQAAEKLRIRLCSGSAGLQASVQAVWFLFESALADGTKLANRSFSAACSAGGTKPLASTFPQAVKACSTQSSPVHSLRLRRNHCARLRPYQMSEIGKRYTQLSACGNFRRRLWPRRMRARFAVSW